MAATAALTAPDWIGGGVLLAILLALAVDAVAEARRPVRPHDVEYLPGARGTVHYSTCWCVTGDRAPVPPAAPDPPPPAPAPWPDRPTPADYED